MPASSNDAPPAPRRIWSDPFFYALLAIVSATYVTLIVAMLAADATYLFTSDMRQNGRIDFETYADEARDEVFEAGQIVDSQFSEFGLTVAWSGVEGSPLRWPMILDSGEPPMGWESLGSPNEEYDGPGVGVSGGRRGAAARRNRTRLRNVLVLSSEADQLEPDTRGGRLVFTWTDPVRVDEVSVLNVDRIGGKITTFDEGGAPLGSWAIDPTGPNGVRTVEMLDADADPQEFESRVKRLEISLPDAAAVTEVRFKWPGRVLTDWQRENPGFDRLLRNPLTLALANPAIQYSIKFSLISCTVTAIISLWVAVPIGYLLSRHRFFGRNLLDAMLDIPIVLPPLVVGLSLLILFQFAPRWLHDLVVFQIPAVILAQFAVACAFAVRTMRATFDHIDVRREQVALTLGCSRWQAFGMIVIPEAGRGILTAGTLAWARALGEFGPLLIFAGATRYKTEVLSTTVFLEMTVGDLGAAVAVSLIMVLGAVSVLVVARLWGTRELTL